MKKVLIVKFRNNHLSHRHNRYIAKVLSNANISITNIIEELIEEGIDQSRETMMEIITQYNRKFIDYANTDYKLKKGTANPTVNINEKLYANKCKKNMKAAITLPIEVQINSEAKTETTREKSENELATIDFSNPSKQNEHKTIDNHNSKRNVDNSNVDNNPACGILFHNWLLKR